MARSAERPAPLSQMPGQWMRWVSVRWMGSVEVPGGKTVSRCAEMRMQGAGVVDSGASLGPGIGCPHPCSVRS